MKRDQLKELGLDDGQIKQVMDLNGKDINKAKASSTSLTAENEEVSKNNKG